MPLCIMNHIKKYKSEKRKFKQKLLNKPPLPRLGYESKISLFPQRKYLQPMIVQLYSAFKIMVQYRMCISTRRCTLNWCPAKVTPIEASVFIANIAWAHIGTTPCRIHQENEPYIALLVGIESIEGLSNKMQTRIRKMLLDKVARNQPVHLCIRKLLSSQNLHKHQQHQYEKRMEIELMTWQIFQKIATQN